MPQNPRHAPPLPARFLDVLAALPAAAWVEDAEGKILACNRDPAPDDDPAATAAYPLPSVDGSARPLRLVAQVSGADENGCHARMISALLSLLLGPKRPGSLRLTPRQRDIYRQLSQGHCYKTIAARLGLTHDAVRQQIVTLRRKLGSSHIPLLRRRIHHGVTEDTEDGKGRKFKVKKDGRM